jgi:hypothetical protein
MFSKTHPHNLFVGLTHAQLELELTLDPLASWPRETRIWDGFGNVLVSVLLCFNSNHLELGLMLMYS